MYSTYAGVAKTFTLTATAAGADLKTALPDLPSVSRVMLMIYPGRARDVEFRKTAGDANTRHVIHQNAGGDEPYPDGPWVFSQIPGVLYASQDTPVTIEVLTVH